MTNLGLMNEVLADIAAHRSEQEARYGHVNDLHEDGTGPNVQWLTPLTGRPAFQIERDLRQDYEASDADGVVTWMRLVREEIAEAFMESDPDKLEAELIQAAALIVSWIERIRSRKANLREG